ncbi:MAG TPA: homocysteine S-methyltransferase family protein [Thermoanaerobaculia bacterium]|nr:homocysteine S-methyltransferase family protein [Thermoanaerobaculia bacterium]HQR67756.1 homocysteine S-methyltransferase family protein [Thermoanaerobaculia bacterium]
MSFRAALEDAAASGRPLLLDAAMGTELAVRGADTSPPLWSARALRDDPDLVRTIHAENVAAGADVLTLDSFRLHERNVRRERREAPSPDERGPDAGRLIARAAALARRAAADAPAGKRIWIAGSLAPLEDCYRPDLVPSRDDLDREHREMAEALAAAGCDLILVETMNAVRELVAAVRAAEATGLPVVASMVTNGDGRLLSGEPVEEAARSLLALPGTPAAFGVNCVPARLVGRDLDRLREAAPGVPLCVYANTGRALDEARGLYTEPVAPEAYAVLAGGWLDAGRVALVGSCCGTTASHTRALRRLLDERAEGGPSQGK